MLILPEGITPAYLNIMKIVQRGTVDENKIRVSDIRNELDISLRG